VPDGVARSETGHSSYPGKLRRYVKHKKIVCLTPDSMGEMRINLDFFNEAEFLKGVES
jgi:hypothetical protein